MNKQETTAWGYMRMASLCGAVLLVFGFATVSWAGSRMIGGRAPIGWQVFIVPTEAGVEFVLAPGGQRLKYAVNIDAPENRVTTLPELEARLRRLKRLQWVVFDQWERGTPASELARIKAQLTPVCSEQKLGCTFSF